MCFDICHQIRSVNSSQANFRQRSFGRQAVPSCVSSSRSSVVLMTALRSYTSWFGSNSDEPYWLVNLFFHPAAPAALLVRTCTAHEYFFAFLKRKKKNAQNVEARGFLSSHYGPPLKSAQEQMNVWPSQLYVAGYEAEKHFLFFFFFSLGNLLADSP